MATNHRYTRPGDPAADTIERIWDQAETELEGTLAEMRARRAAPAPALVELEPMTSAMATLLGADRPGGLDRYRRLRTWRELGYRGPLDSDANIPDPDDPQMADATATLLALGKTSA